MKNSFRKRDEEAMIDPKNAEALVPTDSDLFARRLELSQANSVRDINARWVSYGLPNIKPIMEFADYKAACEKRTNLREQQITHEKELAEARTAMARGLTAARDDETERQADDILNDRPEEAFAGFEELRSRIARLTLRVDAYSVAIRKQSEIVETIRADRSIDAAADMESAHRAAVGNIADAIEQLRTALDRELAARTFVTRAGYDDRLPVFATSFLTAQLRQGDVLERLEYRANDYGR